VNNQSRGVSSAAILFFTGGPSTDAWAPAHKNEGGRAFSRESSCRLSVLFMLRAACFLDIAVTFGSVAGLRMARAFSTGESKYLSLCLFLVND